MSVKVAIHSLPYAGRKGTYAPGQIVEIDEDEALDLVKSNLATFVSDPTVRVTAVAQPQMETAAVVDEAPEAVSAPVVEEAPKEETPVEG